jgi:hypothetical protein
MAKTKVKARARSAPAKAKASTALVRRKTTAIARPAKVEVLPALGPGSYTVAADGSLQLGALGLVELKFTAEEERVLARPVEPSMVSWRAAKKDGPAIIPYLSHPVYTRWFNEAFGRAGWTLVPIGKPVKTEQNVVLIPYVLHIHGKPVAFAYGEQEYFDRKASGEDNRSQSYGDVIESTVASALRRCAKHLGVGLELWDKAWIESLKGGTRRPPPAQPRQASPSTTAPRDEPHSQHAKEEEPITDPQRKRLWVIIRNSGRQDHEVKMWLKLKFGIDSSKAIKRKDYDYVCKSIEHPGALPLPAFDREPGEDG